MKNKKSSYIFIAVIVALLAVLVIAGNANFNLEIPSSNPSAHENFSGTQNISINFGIPATNGSNNLSITNVSFMWQLAYNHSSLGRHANNTFMLNTTVNNRTCGQVDCANSTFFNYSLDTTTLPDGVYNITIMFYNYTVGGGLDTLGGPFINTTGLVNVTIDNTNPTATSVSPTTAQDNNFTRLSPVNQTFSVRADDLTAGVRSVWFSFDNGSKGSSGFNVTGINNSGTWNRSYNVTSLRGGTHVVRLYVNDTAGNINSSNTIQFVVNTPVNTTWLIPSGQNYSGKNTTIVFNVSINKSLKAPIDQVIFEFDNATGNPFNITASNVTVPLRRFWNASYNVSALVEGSHTVRIFANDTNGNWNRTSALTFVVDKTGPSITVTCDSGKTVGETVTCECSASEGLTRIRVPAKFQGDTDASESTSHSTTGSFTSSTCSATDLMGNVGTGSATYSIAEASSSGSGSGGSGGGSSAGVTGQYAKKVWTSINGGEAASVPVTNGAIGVTEVTFDVKETTYGAWVQVKKRDSFPSTVKSFSNKVYKKIEITKSSTLKDSVISSPVVEFKVAKTWLADSDLEKGQVSLFRYTNGEWVELTTTVGRDDGDYIHYSATTPGFSYFVIGEKTGEANVVAEPTAEPAAEEATTEEAPAAAEPVSSEGESPTWPWVVAIIVVLAALAYWWWSRR